MDSQHKEMEKWADTYSGYVENITVVLVEPISAGNIGSVARVMQNTGFRRLLLVNPVEYQNDEGFSMACNAADVLLAARKFSTLDEAIKDMNVIVGATRRKGKIRRPHFAIGEIVPILRERSVKSEIALLFGRENHGLNNEEIDLCDMLFEIPAHTDNPSMNLSHAVLTLCHALFMEKNPSGPAIELAPREDVVKLNQHLERALISIGYGEPGSEFLLGSIMRNFKRLFGRTGLMEKEVNMLRGILSNLEKRVDTDGE